MVIGVRPNYFGMRLENEKFLDPIYCRSQQVRMMKENLWIPQSRQKSYADHWQGELSLQVGNRVYLEVPPMRGLPRFKVRGKLSPRIFGQFKIMGGGRELNA
jgi:hypothetical protein